MSTEQNKAIVRRLWEEVWNKADLAVADEIFDAAYAEHEKGWAATWLAAFPDTHFAVEDMIAEGDKVVTRFSVRGTHQGALWDIAPTGRQITINGIWIHRLADGKIVEGRDWGQGDWLGLMQQLGAIPTPG